MPEVAGQRYFVDGYHGGITCMRRWGRRGLGQAPVWEFDSEVPRWFYEHLFRRLDTVPDYKAVLEIEAITFEHWEQHDPDLLTEIVRRVREGQIEIADGTYTQPYGHIISTESMVRQFLYGQEILQRTTGAKSVTHYKQEHMFVPNMPGLLLDAGVRYAVLRAHIHHFGCCPSIQEEFIFWQGRDGKTIPAVPNYTTDQYPYGLDGDHLERFEACARQRRVQRVLLSQGRDIVHDQDFIRQFVERWNQDRDPSSWDSVLRHETFILSDWPQMGVSDDELETLHRRGYQTTLPSTFIRGYHRDAPPREFDADYFHYTYLWGAFGDRVLAAIRAAETSLCAAEATAACLGLTRCTGYEDDLGALEEAWKRVLQAQSHDGHIAPGAFSFATDSFPVEMAHQLCRDARERSEEIVQRHGRDLVRCVTEPASTPVIMLFNPLSFRRTDPVEITIELPKGFARGLRLHSQQGELPYDCLGVRRFSDRSIASADVVLCCDIPGFGFQSIGIEPAGDLLPEPVRVLTQTVDTGVIRARVTPGGTLTCLRCCDSDRDWLSTDRIQGNELTADFLDGLVRTRACPGDVECHRGRYITEFTARTRLGDKPVSTCLKFYQGSARIDFDTGIDFGVDTRTAQSGLYMEADHFGAMRVNFNPAFEGEFFSDLALSVEQSGRSVSPGQTFGCITNGQLGLTLINRGNVGYYRSADKGVGLSLILASGDGEYRYGPYPLSGRMRFQYSLVPHRGDWVSGKSVLQAAQVNVPPRCVTMPARFAPTAKQTLLTISRECVVATGLFQRKGMTFLRLWNSLPETVETRVTCGFDVRDAAVTDIFGENRQPLALTGHSVELVFAPFELKTIVLTTNTTPVPG